jgi:lipid-A-disaccharide synthase
VAASDAAAVASGTATLETAVLGTPMAIVYKASALNYALLRPLISIDTFGLVNLVAGRKLAKELIQSDLTPETLASEISSLLKKDRNSQMREELAQVKKALEGENASENAARLILGEISAGKKSG